MTVAMTLPVHWMGCWVKYTLPCDAEKGVNLYSSVSMTHVSMTKYLLGKPGAFPALASETFHHQHGSQ